MFNHVMSEVCFKLSRDVPGEDLDDTIFPTIRALWLPWDSSCLFFGGFANVNIFQDEKLCKTNRNSPG